MITVSTDGSCLRNPGGATGWAWINHDGSHASGGLASGTNQIGELLAVLEAIQAHPGDEPLRIESDSQYAIKCSSEWVHGWKRKGWRTASGGPVQNLAIVQAIDKAIASRSGGVAFAWVRGHQGNHFNERADELAGAAAREAQAGRPGRWESVPAAPVPVPVTGSAEPTVDPAAVPELTIPGVADPVATQRVAALAQDVLF
ncbi:ribonuclease H family protein [Cellulomonas soli]